VNLAISDQGPCAVGDSPWVDAEHGRVTDHEDHSLLSPQSVPKSVGLSLVIAFF